MDAVRHYSMLVDGDWVDADDRFEIRSPATEELVASVAKGGIEQAKSKPFPSGDSPKPHGDKLKDAVAGATQDNK